MAATPKINGTLLPVPQAPVISYDPTRGQIVRLATESAGDHLQALALAYQALRISYDLTISSAKSSIIATASGPQLGFVDVSCDNWQILGNEIQRDVKMEPGFVAMENAYPGTIGYVVRDVDLYNQGLPPGTPAPDPGTLPASAALFQLLIHGHTHKAYSQYVLRHSTNVSNAYAANIADVNIEFIYTPGQLIVEASNATLWNFPLPGRLQFKIQNIAAPTAVPNYLWGWRKLASTETTTANNRIEISTEYWLEQWSTLLYPTVP